MIDRRPALIARCAGVADVIAACALLAPMRYSCLSAAASQHHRQRRLRGG